MWNNLGNTTTRLTLTLLALVALLVSGPTWGFTTPKGLLVCEGVLRKETGELVWHTAKINFFTSAGKMFRKDREYVAFDGFEYELGVYMYNATEIDVFAPENCQFVDDPKDAVDCKFRGTIDRTDGSFIFYKGSLSDEAFFWSDADNGKVCRKSKTLF